MSQPRRPALERTRSQRASTSSGRGGSRARPTARGGHGAQLPVLAALGELLPAAEPADRVLGRFFKERPWLGRGDRATVAETVFDVLRNRRLYAHLAQGGDGPIERRLALLSPKSRLAPNDAERAWLDAVAAIDREHLSPALRFSLPDWLYEALDEPAGAARAALAGALLAPAPLDLRVNTLVASRDDAIRALAEDGIEAAPLELADTALRVVGKPALERSAAFGAGMVEVQDVGSQLLCEFAGVRRGQTVVDFCAGAGGKTLAFAAAMRGTGQVFACDVSAGRLARLRPRLLRSRATNVQPFAIDSETDARLGRLARRADVVFVDAPCSGTGTLRRNPDLKWRLQPADVDRLAGRQAEILAAAARLVKPGGILIYATCSLLSIENQSVAEAFESAHPGFGRETPGEAFSRVAQPDGSIRALPSRDGSDGFFAVRWRRAGTRPTAISDDTIAG